MPTAFRDENDDLIVPEAQVETISNPVDLERLTVGVEVSFTWMGMRRALETTQKEEVASLFNVTSGARIGASKRLLSSKHPVLKDLCKARAGARRLWKGLTLPFDKDGIRLLRIEHTDVFETQMEEHRQAILKAAADLQAVREEILDAEAEALGRVYNPHDYPADFTNQFNLTVGYPELGVNPRLELINKAAFDRERVRVREQFSAAQTKIEALMVDQLRKLVSGLATGLTDTASGERKRLPTRALQNLQDFLTNARSFGVNSNADVQNLLEEAERIASGVEDGTELRGRDVQAALAADLNTALARIEEVAVRYDNSTRHRGRRVRSVSAGQETTVGESDGEEETAGADVGGDQAGAVPELPELGD